MTTENQLFMSLDEVKGIRFECKNCHAKLTLQLQTVNLSSLPTTCVGCGTQWFQGPFDERFKAISVLVHRLSDVRDMQLPVSLTVEVSNPFFSSHASAGKG